MQFANGLGQNGSVPLASDLLRKHSIRELRDLVVTLQADCDSKQTELQLMVGSKYHDFIESADAIASMHSVAAAVGDDILNVSKLGKEVIKQSSFLLEVNQSTVIAGVLHQKTNFDRSDLTSAVVWEHLNACDIFGSAEIIVTTAVLMDILNYGDSSGIASLWLSHLPSENQVESLANITIRAADSNRYLYSSIHTLQSLRQITLEDGYFLLLLANGTQLRKDGETDRYRPSGPLMTPIEITETLVGLIALRSCNLHIGTNGGLDVESSVFNSLDPSKAASSFAAFLTHHNDDVRSSGAGKRHRCLGTVDLALRVYLDGCSERLLASVMGIEDLQEGQSLPEDPQAWRHCVDQLLNAISSVHRVVLDVFLMFFHRDSEQRTLMDKSLSQFCSNFVSRLAAILQDASAPPADNTGKISLNPNHPFEAGIGSSGQTSTSVRHGITAMEDSRKHLHETWSLWFFGRRGSGTEVAPSSSLFESVASRGGASGLLSAACVFCLRMIDSSSSTGDVSALQTKVRTACSSIDAIAALSDCENFGYQPATGPATRDMLLTSRLQRSHSGSIDMNVDAVGGAHLITSDETRCLIQWKNTIWQEANRTLLLSYKPLISQTVSAGSKTSGLRTFSNEKGSALPSSVLAVTPVDLLWSKVFRRPFLHQVESALHASSVSGLYRMQQRLLRALYCVGVLVNVTQSSKACSDGNKMDTSDYLLNVEEILPLKPASNYRERSSLGSGGRCDKEINTSCSSVQIYHLAEDLRSCLASELANLRTGIQLSEVGRDGSNGKINDADEESSHSLARSVQIYSCQLVGQVVVLTRCLTLACRNAKMSPSQSLQSSASYSSCWETAIGDALLLLGRFSWLLKINGSFLLTSMMFHAPLSRNISLLQSAGSAELADEVEVENHHTGHDAVAYYTSYDQLQSAFDIADSDGDGLITYSEALEALQALCVGEEDAVADETAQHKLLSACLWPQDGPDGDFKLSAKSGVDREISFSSSPFAGSSRINGVFPVDLIQFSLTEFELLCAKYVPIQSQINGAPMILQVTLDFNIKLAHEAWVRCVMGGCEAHLRDCMKDCFDPQKVNDVYSAPPFKVAWIQHKIQPDQPDGESTTIDIPSVPSGPIRGFVGELVSNLNSKMVSVDTFQLFYRGESEVKDVQEIAGPSPRKADISCLAAYVSLLVASEAARCVTSCFFELLNSKSKSFTENDLLESSDDAVAIQSLFDLFTAEKVFSSVAQSKETASSLSKCINLCKQMIDPITIHLGLPLLEEYAKDYCFHKRLLMHIPLLTEVDTISASENSSETVVVTHSGEIQRNFFSLASGGTEASQRFSLYPLPSLHNNSSSSSLVARGFQGTKEKSFNDENVDLVGIRGGPAKKFVKVASSSEISASSMLNLGTSLTSGITSYLTRSSGSTTNITTYTATK